MHFYWVTFPSFVPSQRSEQCGKFIGVRQVNLLQVYNKLEVSGTFYKFLGFFSLLHEC